MPLARRVVLSKASCLRTAEEFCPVLDQLVWNTMLRAVLARGARVSGYQAAGAVVRGPANPAIRARRRSIGCKWEAEAFRAPRAPAGPESILRRMSPWLTAIGVFLVGQAAGGAVVGAVIGGVAHSSEEEHGLGPANYPWSHEGMMSSFDASS